MEKNLKKNNAMKFVVSPIVVAVIASLLYLIDALIGGLFVKGGSFMWVGFVFWTVFATASLKERVKALIGVVIGFASAVAMMAITSSFTLNLGTISISCLLGVFLVNGAIMLFENGEKVWINSLSGIFCGIFLSFSGLGVRLNPLASCSSAFTMLGIMLVYGVLGLACGWANGYFVKLWKSKYESIKE